IPSVTVYNASLQVAGGSTGTNYGDTARVTVSGIQPGQVWYIKALAGTTEPGGVGAYGLLVNFGSSPQSAIAPPDTVVAAQPDQDPTTSLMTTGGMINEQLTPHQNHQNNQDADDAIDRITNRSLTGYGDAHSVGDPSGPSRIVGKGHSASESHNPGSPHRQEDTPANSKATRSSTATIVHNHLGIPSREEAARLQAVDAVLASRRPDRPLAMSPSPSRPQRGDPPRGHRSIAHAWA
ncbi:MAG: hypothetical protein JOZ53_25345, partial [Planctomycetaceae bacterium]|nr:hypothetical protein [Planctomycetaceae bacterium]